MSEQVKNAVAIIFALAGLVAYYLMPDKLGAMRLLAVLAGFVAAAAVFIKSERGQDAIAFVREAWVETTKVVWPTRKEVIQTTGVIMLMVVLIAVFLWGVDFTLAWLVRIVI